MADSESRSALLTAANQLQRVESRLSCLDLVPCDVGDSPAVLMWLPQTRTRRVLQRNARHLSALQHQSMQLRLVQQGLVSLGKAKSEKVCK